MSFVFSISYRKYLSPEMIKNITIQKKEALSIKKYFSAAFWRRDCLPGVLRINLILQGCYFFSYSLLSAKELHNGTLLLSSAVSTPCSLISKQIFTRDFSFSQQQLLKSENMSTENEIVNPCIVTFWLCNTSKIFTV